MSFFTVLPLAIVMVSGPQMLSAIFLATSEEWRRNSASFVLGAACSISLVVAAAYALGIGSRSAGVSNTTLTYIVLAVLVLAAVNTYRTRNTAEPPAWMGKLASATPRFSFRLGFLLLGFFPTDILTSAAVGGTLASDGLPVWDAAGFVLVTLLLLSLPGLAILALGERGERFLPKARDWMTDNAWIVNEFVIGIFIVLTLS